MVFYYIVHGYFAAGSIGLPGKGTVVGQEVQIINNGVYQLAMIPLSGWEAMETLPTTGLHPASTESAVINVKDNFLPQQAKPKLYATLMLWKKADETWTDEELVPVKRIKRSAKDISITVSFRDGDEKIVRFD